MTADDTDDVVRTGGMEIAALRKILFGVTDANPDDGDTIADAATAFVDTVEERERRIDAVEAFDAAEPVVANHDVRADGGGDDGE